MKRTYPGIDILKFVFACLIPLLHITTLVPSAFVQYFCRFGVPFFFAASGFFLARSVEKRGTREAMARHVKRVGKLLLVWLVIYSPILLVTMRNDPHPIRSLLFLSPAYLWYLSALLAAGVLFCLIRNRKLRWGLAAVLYLVGTLFGGSWSWLFGQIPGYTEIFLTTRNGLFFGLPMLCVGELAGALEVRHRTGERICCIVSAVLLGVEVWFVRTHTASGADTSMYLLLPLVIYFLLRWSMELEARRDTAWLRDASVAIYVMQFGFITVLNLLRPYTGLSPEIYGCFTWAAVIVGGTVCSRLFANNKILKHLFK